MKKFLAALAVLYMAMMGAAPAQTRWPKPEKYNTPILKPLVSPGYFCRAAKAKAKANWR